MTCLFAIFGLHGLELVIVGLVFLVLFGNKLPGAMRSLGRGLVEFKRGASGTGDDEALPDSRN